MTTVETENERGLRAAIPVFVNSFEQLTYLRDTIDWFHRHGFANVTILEQGSTYAPLMAWLDSPERKARARLHRLASNVGPRAALDTMPDVRDRMIHIFSDPDLALPEPPHPAFLTRLLEHGRRHHAHKTGLALDISEPEAFVEQHLFRKDGPTVAEWEARFWRKPLGGGVYRANVDTTFHVANPSAPPTLKNRWRNLFRKTHRLQCIRVAGDGFTARHRPWYREDGQTDEERQNYVARSGAWNSWNDLARAPSEAAP